MSIALRPRIPAVEVCKVRMSPEEPAGCQEGASRCHLPGNLITDWGQLSLRLATSETHFQMSQS